MPPLEHIVQSVFPEVETVASCTPSSQNVPLIRGLPGTRITLIVISRASGPVTKSTTCCRHPVVPSKSSVLPNEFLVIMPDTDLAQAEIAVRRLRWWLERWNSSEQRASANGDPTSILLLVPSH
jgi:hypothetical protein